MNLKIARLDGCSFNELPARLNEERRYGHAALAIENGQKGKTRFWFWKIHQIFKLLFASASLGNLARSSTVRQLRRLSPPNGLILMAVSDSSTINRRLLDATHLNTRKRRCFLRLAGLRCLTIICEFLTIFEYFYFFRRISDHSLVGLDNGAMLLLGGDNWGSDSEQTGIWQLKEEWSRIGELSKVWKFQIET